MNELDFWLLQRANKLVGAPALAAVPVLEPGIAGQVRAGRSFAPTDFTALLGLATPAAIYNLSDLTDASGNGHTLTNKGTVTFGSGITGAATEAAYFTGSTAQALYFSDTGAGDPFRIPYGSVGCWFKTAKTGTSQVLLSKYRAVSLEHAYLLSVNANNVVSGTAATDGTTDFGVVGTAQVCDNRWHFVVMTYDGATMALYLDGQPEAFAAVGAGPIYGPAVPFNVGGYGADGTTAAASPAFGPVDAAFVTQDVLTLDQVRVLYAAKVAHGFGAVPPGFKLNVRRLRKGGALASSVFSTAPLHLYNFTGGSAADSGSLGTTLTYNGGVLSSPGPDGTQADALSFISGNAQSASATDTGLPAGTAARSYGAWVKSSTIGGACVAGWGTSGTADARILFDGSGHLQAVSGADTITSSAVYADGQWHFAVVVEDPSATDGLKRKLYVDGKCVGTSATLNTLTLVGASGFRVGANPGASAGGYLNGQADGVFVCGYAMSADEQAKLYAQGGPSQGPSPKNPGDHVEAVDATYVYPIFDTLDSQHQIDLAVTA